MHAGQTHHFSCFKAKLDLIQEFRRNQEPGGLGVGNRGGGVDLRHGCAAEKGEELQDHASILKVRLVSGKDGTSAGNKWKTSRTRPEPNEEQQNPAWTPCVLLWHSHRRVSLQELPLLFLHQIKARTTRQKVQDKLCSGLKSLSTTRVCVSAPAWELGGSEPWGTSRTRAEPFSIRFYDSTHPKSSKSLNEWDVKHFSICITYTISPKFTKNMWLVSNAIKDSNVILSSPVLWGRPRPHLSVNKRAFP